MEASRSSFERPAVVVLVVLALVALHAPSLGWGFFADDFAHRLALEHPDEAGPIRPWSLYDFGDAQSVRASFGDDVPLPWWLDPAWKARFFRPVASLVLWADHALLGRDAVAHHALGLAWHALYLCLAWRLFRAAGLSGGVALLALLVLGAEDGAATTVGWVANRNALVEGVFAAAALLCAVRGRERGERRWLTGALVCAALAAGSKESGVAAPLACALVLGTARAPRARRAGVLAALLAAAYLAFLALAGYGVRSEFYPVPWGSPGAAAHWARRLTGLLAAGPVATLSPFPVDALVVVPGAFWPLAGACAVLVALLARPWWRAARALPLGPHLAAFALLALVPQASAPPSDRLLYVPALGLAPATALLLARWARAPRRATRLLGGALVALAVPLSALALVARGTLAGPVAEDVRGAFLEAELERDPPARRDVLLLQSPSVLAALSPQATWRWLTGDRETRFHALQLAARPLAWTRTGERTFELETLGTPFVALLFERVFRAHTPLVPGPQPRTGALAVEVLDVPVTRVRFTLDEPLESPRWRFLAWQDGRWRSLAPPALGERVALPAGTPLRPWLP